MTDAQIVFETQPSPVAQPGPDAYVIEVRGETAGIVARDGQTFRFYASSHQFNHLDGEAFSSPRDAERAAFSAGRTRSRERAYASLRG